MDGKLYEIVCGHGFNKGNCPHILRKQWSCGECTSARYIERIRQVKPTEEKQEEKTNTDKND
jgi:hypothetical protein